MVASAFGLRLIGRGFDHFVGLGDGLRLGLGGFDGLKVGGCLSGKTETEGGGGGKDAPNRTQRSLHMGQVRPADELGLRCRPMTIASPRTIGGWHSTTAFTMSAR